MTDPRRALRLWYGAVEPSLRDVAFLKQRIVVTLDPDEIDEQVLSTLEAKERVVGYVTESTRGQEPASTCDYFRLAPLAGATTSDGPVSPSGKGRRRRRRRQR